MKTNWKDDIFARRKLRLEQNDDGTVTPVDETEYTQQGDAFGAKELNAIGEEVNTLAVEVAAAKKSVSDGKALVAAAITAKRVVTAATATFAEFKANIDKIRLGSGNALKGHVLAGRTFTNDDGVEYTGEMPEHGSKSITLPINGSQNLAAGHYSGIQIRQSIPTLGGQAITPQTYAQTIAAAGKYGTGNHAIAAVPLPPANAIKKGYRYWIGSNYVDGTFEGYVLTANDMYKNGYNPAGFTSGSYVIFYLDRMEIVDSEYGKSIVSGNPFNFTGHANLKMECELCNGASGGRMLEFHGRQTAQSSLSKFGSYTVKGSFCTGLITISIPVPANLGSYFIDITIGASITGKIYRIWLE